MSQQPIALSSDLLRLRNEGYDINITGGHLVVRDVPYVNSARSVLRGALISKLDLAGNVATKPTDHTVFWSGEHPCHSDGSRIAAFEHSNPRQLLADGLVGDFMFSAKADYRDYHHKVTTYVERIVAEAAAVQPGATAKTYPVIQTETDDDIFNYVDTASSRSGIGALNDRLKGLKIGIVGLGGTGGYVLDLVAKTHVAEIHLFDADVFSQHNAFRAPGAPNLDTLRAKPQKVAHFASVYRNMRRGIFTHDLYLDAQSALLVDALDFVFLCLDRGAQKYAVVGSLVANKTPFIDVGMGVVLEDGQLGGIVRTTTCTPENMELAAPHVSYAAGDAAANEYSSNIQIAELNSLNAAMAVIRWKRLWGVYRDSRDEYYAGYSIPSGEIVMESRR